MTEQQIDYSQAESLGISHEAYDEVLDIVGHIPTIDELSTRSGHYQILYGTSSLEKDLQSLAFEVK